MYTEHTYNSMVLKIHNWPRLFLQTSLMFKFNIWVERGKAKSLFLELLLACVEPPKKLRGGAAVHRLL